MLVNNINIFQQYVQTTGAFNFDKQIKAHLQKAQATELTRLFGSALVNALTTRWNNGNPSPALTTHESVVIQLFQNIISNFGYVKALSFLTVQNTGSGAAQAESPVNKPLFKWQKIEIADQALEDAWNAVENAIVYIIANRTQPEFATWQNSPAEVAQLNLIINTAQAFTQHFPINYSRRTFEAIKSAVKDAELLNVKGIIGTALFGQLKTQIAAQNVTPNNQALLQYIAPALANYAMAIALFKSDFVMDELGARIITTTSTGGTDTSKIKNAITLDGKRAIAEKCNATANAYMADCVAYLTANASTYPLYVSTAPSTITNEQGSSFVL